MSADNVMVTVQYGTAELIDRQMALLLTGDPTADMIIKDLADRLNKHADRIERQQRQIAALKEVARNRCMVDLEDTVEMDIADIEAME